MFDFPNYYYAKADFDRRYFTALIKKYNGNIVQVSKASGVERKSLYRRFEKLGIPYRQIAPASNGKVKLTPAVEACQTI